MKKIRYNGKSKVIIRLCEAFNELIDNRIMLKDVYDRDNDGVVDNARKVNGHTVLKDVPANAVFTDTVYNDEPLTRRVSMLESDMPEATSELVNDSGFITKTINDLTNYYRKNETYTQTEINVLISAIPKFNIRVVDSLPTADISTTTVYLLKTSEVEENLYTEYIYVETSEEMYKWEILGTQSVDLRGYVTEDGLEKALSDYYTRSQIDKSLEDKVDKAVGKGLSTNDYTTEEKDKLSGIDAGAEVNVQSDWDVSDPNADAYIKNKPTLGTAASKDVALSGDAGDTQVVMGSDSRLTDSRNAKDVYAWAKTSTKPTYTASEVGAIAAIAKGSANGVAELDENGLVPASQLPSYVDDVLEGTAQNVTTTGAGTYSASSFVLFGESDACIPETGKTYVDITSNVQYRWTGTVFVSMGSNIVLGETSATAYRGDRGKTAYNHAADSSKLTTATASGLYKVASTAQGHIASLIAVRKADITGLGIPERDTTYPVMSVAELTTGTDTTSRVMRADYLNAGIKSIAESEEIDTAENTVAFTSADVDDGEATTWTSVAKISSNEKHKSLFSKISQMFKNVRYLYELLGTTDISQIGDGTVKGAISAINSNLVKTIVVDLSNKVISIPDNGLYYAQIHNVIPAGHKGISISTVGIWHPSIFPRIIDYVDIAIVSTTEVTLDNDTKVVVYYV